MIAGSFSRVAKCIGEGGRTIPRSYSLQVGQRIEWKSA